MTDVGLEVVRFLSQTLQIDPEWVVWSDRGFIWWAGGLAQHAWAEPCFEDNDFTITRIHVRTDLLDGFVGADARLLQLMQFSSLANLSSVVRDPANPTRIHLVASIYVHADTAGWLQYVLAWVAASQNGEAHTLAPNLAKFTGTRPALSEHPLSGPRIVLDDMLNVIAGSVAPDGLRFHWAFFSQCSPHRESEQGVFNEELR